MQPKLDLLILKHHKAHQLQFGLMKRVRNTKKGHSLLAALYNLTG